MTRLRSGSLMTAATTSGVSDFSWSITHRPLRSCSRSFSGVASVWSERMPWAT